MFVVAMVVGADLLRDDSGLITGLVIGAILVNRPPRGTEPHGVAIERAKLVRSWRERIGTVTTFLIGILFIILSARVTPDQIAEIGWVSIAFVAVLVSLGRPARRRAFDARLIAGPARASVHRLDGTPRDRRGRDLVDVRARPKPGRHRRRGGGPDPDHVHRDRRNGADLRAQRGPGGARAGVARTGPGGVLLIGSSPVGRAIGRALQARDRPWCCGPPTRSTRAPPKLTGSRCTGATPRTPRKPPPPTSTGCAYALAVG